MIILYGMFNAMLNVNYVFSCRLVINRLFYKFNGKYSLVFFCMDCNS